MDEDPVSMEVDNPESSDDEFASCWPGVFKPERDYEYIEFYADGVVIGRPFPKSIAQELLESWPVVESAVAECGMECKLNVNRSYVVFETTKHTCNDGFRKGRDVLALLSSRVPADRAARIMMVGVPRDIIRTGHHRHGICTQFGIKEDEYRKRKKLLMTLPEKELAALTGCEVYFRPKHDLVAAIGPDTGLKLARKIVTDCIVHKVPPARRIKDLLSRAQLSRSLKKLSLG